ncbi:hypothetical protein SEA_SMELLYB_43 [Mycobacterium phage SmellyB]|uniref:Uncharacterized protein n=2 Tax=Gladiatorvirus TaxID=2948726 RepID=V5R406_9CAUD|nr:hypothetical protein X820_gp072 [Mycobacterium phage CloudWang3]YP_009224165.1 hypothetical protein AXJ19_gp069 [Mycobacterium phage VohminGhazi]QXO14796.1 hypothetical protein SEA_SMELLYB_43 [Mycobacterium phage SmellyB]QYC54109.1 hypothetical protein SEA_ROKSOLANA_44 [Mycobacterium phage Roksolana]QYW01248.1 hypothetical protein SEA_HOOT_43 [Mycobacterium phage Hoot]AHB29833.1 hypothetical protein CLOUDWANG3_43 [Mycobacterium phage CloudWang3]AIS73616.1 hypothetical protein PBI_VOHMINGHA
MRSSTWTAVFAETDTEAEQLAKDLGLTGYVAYGVDEDPARFEGARASRTFIKSGTLVPIDLMELIIGTTTKLYGGKIIWARVDNW